MKKLLIVLCIGILSGCNNEQKDDPVKKDAMRMLYTDSINVVALTEKLVIHESVCRGCAYETSTRFDMSDPLKIVKLQDIITTDNNKPGMSGGNISKDLIITPLRTGSTTIRLYKTWGTGAITIDSTKYTSYTIEVRD